MFPRSHCFSEFSCLLPQRNGIRCHGSQQNANQSNGNRSSETRVIRWNANHQNVKHQNAIRQNAIRQNALHRAAHHWHQHQPSGYRPLCSLSSKKNTHKHCLLPLESKIYNIYDVFRNWGRSHQRSAHLPHTLPWWRTPDDSCLWQQTETFPSLSHHRVQRFILKNQLTTYRLLQRFYTCSEHPLLMANWPGSGWLLKCHAFGFHTLTILIVHRCSKPQKVATVLHVSILQNPSVTVLSTQLLITNPWWLTRWLHHWVLTNTHLLSNIWVGDHGGLGCELFRIRPRTNKLPCRPWAGRIVT